MNETFMKEKPVLPLLVSMALPNVISMLVNSLYNIVDSLFVARINESAMTALSLVFPVQNLLNAIAIGFGIGINALVALCLGAGEHEKADQAATHGMAFSLLHGILGSAIAIAIMLGSFVLLLMARMPISFTLGISSVLTESRVTNVVSAAADSASSGADAVLSLPALLPQEADGKLPDATAPDAVNVRVCFDDDNATGFSYDADSGLYRMLHADGTPQLDANNGQQAGFDNLLVLFSASELRDDGKTYDYDLSMGGGVWLNGGHLWTITWTQGRDNTLLLYDADGRTMNIEAGTSYIALVTSLTGQELTVTNSSGEEILG